MRLRLRALRRPTWQNAYAERLIGSIRRECTDHVIVFSERHLRHLLGSYLDYYNETRTHLSVPKIKFWNNGDEVRRGRAQI